MFNCLMNVAAGMEGAASGVPLTTIAWVVVATAEVYFMANSYSTYITQQTCSPHNHNIDFSLELKGSDSKKTCQSAPASLFTR